MMTKSEWVSESYVIVFIFHVHNGKNMMIIIIIIDEYAFELLRVEMLMFTR
jgi:hypothetical protein